MMSEKSVEIPLLMTRHYPDLDSPSDWLKQICHVAGPIKSITQILTVILHQYGH